MCGENMKKIIVLLIVLIILTGCNKNNDNYIENREKENKTNVITLENDNSNIEFNKEIDLENNNYQEEKPNITYNIIEKNNNDILVTPSNVEKEEDVVNYFEELKNKIKEKLNKDTWENAKESIINTLNTAYGFCFKGEEIGGYTLNELSESTKEKILNIVFDIDRLIEEKSPGYKNSFKESYSTMIESAKNSLNLIKNKLSNIFDKK